MAPSIYTGLILFTLLHLGMPYSIWGPSSEQDTTLDAVLDIFKSVNRNPEGFDTDEASKLLANKLLSLFKQVHGMQTRLMETVGDEQSRYISEVINIIVHRKDDSKLQKAEQEIHNNQGLYVNDYLYFLNRQMLPGETKAFIRRALELDNDQSFERSEAMSSFFKVVAIQSQNELKNYRQKFGTTRAFLNELRKYNERNEWNAFMMMTTAHRLQSLESNDNNYLKEFKRLRKQLMDKLAMHQNKFYSALGEAESERV